MGETSEEFEKNSCVLINFIVIFVEPILKLELLYDSERTTLIDFLI